MVRGISFSDEYCKKFTYTRIRNSPIVFLTGYLVGCYTVKKGVFLFEPNKFYFNQTNRRIV